MAVAPPPRLVAEAILRILTQANPPPVVTVGGMFQAQIAPLLARLAPRRAVEWFLRKYYRL
jgi:glyoxylate carboligase